jgi:hypothetical protein
MIVYFLAEWPDGSLARIRSTLSLLRTVYLFGWNESDFDVDGADFFFHDLLENIQGKMRGFFKSHCFRIFFIERMLSAF